MKTEREPGVIQVAANARKAGVEMYPMLFILVATAPGDVVMLYNEIHYTKEEAETEFRKRTLTLKGIEPHLWRVKMIACISAVLLEEKFKEYAEKSEKEKKQSKNKVMLEIIEKKDSDLLHRNISRFTDAEVMYMHEKISQ